METLENEKTEQKNKKGTIGYFFLIFSGFIVALVAISQLVMWLFK